MCVIEYSYDSKVERHFNEGVGSWAAANFPIDSQVSLLFGAGHSLVIKV